MNNYVLGGGINGCIFAMYNPDYTILTKEQGQMSSSPIMERTILFHALPYTKKFLKRFFNEEPKIKKMKIGYYYNGRFNDDIDLQNRMKYIRRKIGYSIQFNNDLTFSSENNVLEVYDIPLTKIHQRCVDMLRKSGQYQIRPVVSLDGHFLHFEKGWVQYDSLVNTLPANVFFSHFGNGHHFKYKPLSFYFDNNSHDLIDTDILNCGFDIVYYCDRYDIHEFTRTNIFNDGVLFEYPTDSLPHGITIPNAIMEDKGVKFPIENPRVMHLGRFAEWKHSLLLEDSIRKSELFAIQRGV